MTVPPRLPAALGLAFAGSFGFVAAAPAFADKAVALSFQETPAYARIIAKWADGEPVAPKIDASVANQVLVLKFDQKVVIDLEALKKGLPSWAALTRLDPDGMTARIGLRQMAKLHVSTSLDLIAVDLAPTDAKAKPPDLVSPLVAKRAEAAEKARQAASPPAAIDPLEVRGSDAGSSSRLSFYWPGKVNYKVVSRGEGTLKLLFAHRAKADLAYLHIDPPANLADFQGENTDKGYLVTIASKDKLPIKDFVDGEIVVIDISRPAPPPSDAPPTKAAAAAAEAAGPKGAKATPATTPKGAEKPTETNKPLLLVPPKSLSTNIDAVAKAETAETVAAASTLGGSERKTSLAGSWTDPAPRNGVVDVKVLPLATGLELQATFAQPAPAAVFTRGSAVWAVFAANADLKVDPGALPVGFKVRTLRAKDATMMRLDAPKGLTVSAVANDAVWTIRLAPTATKPQRFLRPEHTKGKEGRSQIETMVPQAAGIVWFEDPSIGDQVAVAVSYGPTSASTTPLDFVEASLPATAHGLAIIPKSDAAIVTLQNEKVVVAMPGRSDGPSTSVAATTVATVAANPAFIDFARWGGKGGDGWFKRRDQLEKDAIRQDRATPQGSAALMDLARFYLGHEMAYEALGVLRVATHDRAEVEQDPQFLGLRGAAEVITHRLTAGESDLSKGPLRSEPSAALWRGLIAVDRREWERATDFFQQAGDQIHAYTPAWAAHFSVAAAEAALHSNDYDRARRMANDAAAVGHGEDAEHAKLVLANLTAVIDGPAKAYDAFADLSRTASEPVAVRAELRRLELGVAAGKVPVGEAIAQLESLRFRWRGDDIETQTVGILADQYMNMGRFRDALQLAQAAALRDPSAPGARDLRVRLSDYFRRLFLNGEVDRLDPIQALALFYEFPDLTPIGVDGDLMIRKLAQRLVAFDLLDPAANLLQHQVDNRLRGVGQSAVAVDLAKIYLWDKRPDRALAAINGSRQPNLPKDLALERRLLEAAAYRDLGRFDHTIELVEPLEGVEAKSLLADAYWRSRQWAEASKAFTAMLPPPGQAGPDQAPVALRAAIAARMAKDAGGLAALRTKYMPLFEKSPDRASFDLITAQTDVSGAAVAEALKRMADAPSVDAFATAMKARFDNDRKILADKAAKDKAARDQAAKEQAAKDKAVKEEAARAAAAKAEAAKQQAAEAAKAAKGAKPEEKAPAKPS